MFKQEIQVLIQKHEKDLKLVAESNKNDQLLNKQIEQKQQHIE